MQNSKPEPNHAQQYKELSLDTKPIVLLFNNSKLRYILSNALNYQQVIPNDDGLSRDYRGLAELLDVSAKELRNLDRSSDPMHVILAYLSSINSFYLNNNSQINNQTINNRNAEDKIVNQYCTIELLVRSLEKLDRYDVIDDLLDEIRLNPIEEQKSIIDKPTFNSVKYDAYVSYVDSDLPFVKSLCDYLESSAINLKLYLRDRDSKMGSLEYAEFTELMEKQCNRLLVILSPDFLESPECKFQTQFTLSLQVGEKYRRLIPIVYRECELPSEIRYLSKINLTKPLTPEWAINKLVLSLLNDSDQNRNGRSFPPFRFNFDALPSIQSVSSSDRITDSSSVKDVNNSMKTNKSTAQTKVNNLPVNPPVENKKEKISSITTNNSSLKNPIKLNNLDNKSNFLNSKLTTTKSVLSTQTFNTDDTDALIEKQKNFKLLSRIWKKINISGTLNRR